MDMLKLVTTAVAAGSRSLDGRKSLSIVNRQNMTPLTLAAKLAKKKVLFGSI
jgi:hypothetical protein